MITTKDPSRDEGYQRSLEVHRRIEALYPRIEQQTAYFRVMMPGDRAFPQVPGKTAGVRLDPVVCALAIKAATTKRAILAVCELGDGDNALALARVLLENACLLEWLIRGDGRRRLEAYVMFMSVEHERIVGTIDRHEDRFIAAGATWEVKSDPYHRAISKHVFGDKKSHRPTWEFDRMTGKGAAVSVHDVFREIADGKHSFEHDVLYGVLGSDIVHSGPFSLSRIQHAIGNRPTFVLQPMPVSDMCSIALASSNAAMFLVLDSLTEYLGLDLSAELAPLKATSKANPYARTGAPSGVET
jgi:uncharacterized protein DUF5677